MSYLNVDSTTKFQVAGSIIFTKYISFFTKIIVWYIVESAWNNGNEI